MKMKSLLFVISLVVAASPATPTPLRSLPPRPWLPPRPPVPRFPPIAQPPPSPFGRRLPPVPRLPPIPQTPPSPSSSGNGALDAPSTATPTDCYMPLFHMFSCLDFLTNSSNATPTAQCCDGFRSVVNSSAIICLCHVMDRDFERFTHYPPINMVRVLLLPVQCAVVLPLRTFTMCSCKPLLTALTF